ncbi:MAG: DUF2490 domain-containing protein [bacterium]|nr:DUF2490 domain-containing protein [bacterium]
MNIKIILIGLFCAVLGLAAFGQNLYQVGLMPSVNLNKKLDSKWEVNVKTEARQYFYQDAFNEPSKIDFQYDLTDFSVIGSRKVGLGKKITGGYLLRVSDASPVHRFIQQFIVTQQLRSFRLSHRFATDQTLSFEEPTEYRLRYRIASEIPLNGQRADLKEFYVKVNNEYLGSMQQPDFYWEVRLIPMLGYTAFEKHKIELGIDYRNRSFLNFVANRQSYWARVNWYISL